jgi:hypothetical protein
MLTLHRWPTTAASAWVVDLAGDVTMPRDCALSSGHHDTAIADGDCCCLYRRHVGRRRNHLGKKIRLPRRVMYGTACCNTSPESQCATVCSGS